MVKRSNKRKVNRKKLRSDLDAMLRRVDRLPDLEPRAPDEIVGYDENGIPCTNTTLSSSGASVHDARDATEILILKSGETRSGEKFRRLSKSSSSIVTASGNRAWKRTRRYVSRRGVRALDGPRAETQGDGRRPKSATAQGMKL